MQKGKHLQTPLHAAAQHSSTEIVNLLLEFGADINAKNSDFERPVDLAAPSSLVERLLLFHEGKFYMFIFETTTCIFKKPNPPRKTHNLITQTTHVIEGNTVLYEMNI